MKQSVKSDKVAKVEKKALFISEIRDITEKAKETAATEKGANLPFSKDYQQIIKAKFENFKGGNFTENKIDLSIKGKEFKDLCQKEITKFICNGITFYATKPQNVIENSGIIRNGRMYLYFPHLQQLRLHDDMASGLRPLITKMLKKMNK